MMANSRRLTHTVISADNPNKLFNSKQLLIRFKSYNNEIRNSQLIMYAIIFKLDTFK